MLRVSLSVDCDSCHEPLDTALVCSDFEELVWSDFARKLVSYALQRGWNFHQASGRFICLNCLEFDSGLPLRLSANETLLALHALSHYMNAKGNEVSSNTTSLKQKFDQYLRLD